MKKITLRLFVALVMSTLLLSCSAEDDGIFIGSESSVVKDITLTYSTFEYQVLDLVNDYRETQGLNKLPILNLISREAKGHTDYMIETGEINHNNFSTRSRNLIENASAKIVAENVAYGFGTAQGVVNAWIESDGHRKNIENDSFTDFGISTKRDDQGRYYYTHIFIKR
jgi:uncharacterized protein YkwD